MVTTTILPPPVKSANQTTEFVVGDTVLIDMSRAGRKHELVVTVESARVTERVIRPDLTVRWVRYMLSYEGDGKPFHGGCMNLGEVELKRKFIAYVWVTNS